MKKLSLCLLLLVYISFTACSIKTPVQNHYKLDAFCKTKKSITPKKTSIMITRPEAVTGYQTEEMLYIVKPYELSHFAHNAWVGPPASMLFPLIIQSLQSSNYFSAVASTPYADKSDYQLDTQLIELQQNFTMQPSVMQFTVKAVLSHVDDHRVIASKIFSKQIPCPYNTPYGGVIAANQAAAQYTKELVSFVVYHIGHNHA